MLNRMTSALTVLAALLVTVAAHAQRPEPKPRLIQVTDRVYSAVDFAIGNVIYLLTDKSVVVVDTTESQIAALETLQEFRKVCKLPITTIIYTHHHPDHIRGAKAFKGSALKVIAQKLFVSELAKYTLLQEYNQKVNAVQFGTALPQSERGNPVKLHLDSKLPLAVSGYLPPDTLFDEQHAFEEGGVRFELYHTQGETADHLMVWLPQQQVLLPGDLFYWSFPMLSSPMKPDRPVLDWANSLDRMRKLRPAHFVPSHGPPLKGREIIDITLSRYSQAIRFVHDETLERIKAGLPLEEIRQQVRLPEELARLPFLAPNYGRVEWAVNGVYREYTGWYDFNPAHLNPARSTALHRSLLEASGGTDAVLKRARKALQDKQPQLAVELLDVILNVDAKNAAAHAVAADAYQRLGDATKNLVEINIYRTAAQEHRKLAGK